MNKVGLASRNVQETFQILIPAGESYFLLCALFFLSPRQKRMRHHRQN